MELDRLVFYNAYHLGDLHVSQEFVRWLVKAVPANHYEYYHINIGRDVLWELDGVVEQSLTNLPLVEQIRKPVIFNQNVAYVNTWYGASPTFVGISSCTLKTLYALFSTVAQNLDVELLPLGAWAIPQWPTPTPFKIDQFIVLVCNCMPLSSQATEIDFHAIASDLVAACPEATFIFTNPPPVGPRNPDVLYVDEMAGSEANLRECIVAAGQADVIVGQSSGPYTFALNRRNLLDPKKTFVCFCKPKQVAHWAGRLARCTTIWEPRTDLETVKDRIIHTIKEAQNG
jgi:hypothetical protein